MKNNSIIVAFHIGRGGYFYNAGFISFRGEDNLQKLLNYHDEAKGGAFSAFENQKKAIYEKDLEQEIRQHLQDAEFDGDYSELEEKFGITEESLGQIVYNDCNGNLLVTTEELELGVGIINREGGYDTDYCQHLTDCSDEELQLIADYTYYKSSQLEEELKAEMLERGLINDEEI